MNNHQSFQIQSTPNAEPGFSGTPGGAQRYSVPTQAAAPDNFGPQSRARDFSQHQSCSSADLGNASALGAVSPTGRPLAPSEIKGDTIISIGGLQLRADQAERLGLISKDQIGYSIAAAGVQADAAQAPPKVSEAEANGEKAPPLPAAAQGSLQALSGGGQDTVGASLEVLSTGELSAATANRLATRLGIEPGAVQAHVAQIAEGFRSVASGLLGGDENLELAAEQFPELLAQVSKGHALRGDVSGYKTLASKLTNYRIDHAEAVESPDPSLTIRSFNGKHLVSGRGIPGGEIELKLAIRLGLISLA